MPTAAPKPSGGPLRKRIVFEPFHSLCGDLQEWRTDPVIEELEREKGSALVLGFVKGLRLSAQLIYILRERLSHTDLEVDWGHLLDPEGRSLSPECDVIIHEKGYERRWNGGSANAQVMDFKFINSSHAVAVISCKSFAQGVDEEYAKKLRPYVKNVLLFAECCAPDKIRSLQNKAKKAGYLGFWFLYTIDRATGNCTKDEKVWQNFFESIARIMDHGGSA